MWDFIRQLWSNPQLPWMILWVGLLVLIVGLIVLMRTHWGQSKPLRKCAVLSLFVHLLLAAFATTVEIVSHVNAGPPGHGGGDPLRISLVGGETGDSLIEGTSDGIARRPWEKIPTENATVPETNSLARPDLATPSTASSLANDLLQNPTVSADPPRLPVESVPTKTLEVADDTPNKPRLSKTAEPIEVIAPQKMTAVESPVPKTNSPERVAMEPTQPLKNIDSNGGPVAESFDTLPPLTAIPSSFALPREATDTTSVPTRTPVAANVDPIGDPFSSSGTTPTAPTTPNWANTPMTPVKSGTIKNENIANNSDPNKDVPLVPTPYSLRILPNHGGAVKRGGGSPEAEAAVQAALAWLAANQNADGRWEAKRFGAGTERNVLGHDRRGAGAKADTGVTGLALLAFLGSGSTHHDGQYAVTVRKGMEFLLNSQGRDGNLGGEAEMFAFMYSHGMATLAVSEDYAMTHDNRIEPFLRRAIEYTITSQHPQTGGWRYQPNDTGDMSQLGWQLMSLKSAELAGMQIPQRTRDGMVRFLKSVTSGPHNGRASYRPAEQTSRTMTAEALVCRQFLGMDRFNPASDEAGDYLLEDLPGQGKTNLYYWYYGSLSMYQLQGDHWKKWNNALQTSLLKAQESSGELTGSWSPDNDVWGGYGGRVYSTAMATLCLEVYYRYLPLYGENGDKVDR